MDDIKRYTVKEVCEADRQIMGTSKWCCRDDVAKLITDHKSVVEALEYQLEGFKDQSRRVRIREKISRVLWKLWNR
ncbi:MAG: hypothetical protein PF569_01380 [Candidatus Woesearchaeota archaeon]|jgi:hypothetical protein|nr:hypothetical protein [Candidatus Woesearchaeota archaeon]